MKIVRVESVPGGTVRGYYSDCQVEGCLSIAEAVGRLILLDPSSFDIQVLHNTVPVVTTQLQQKPTIAFCGHGRAGKDTAAKFLAKHFQATYTGSLSWAALPMVASRLGLCAQEAWETRHKRRMEWYDICNEFRRNDPARLIKMALSQGNIVVGIRDREELLASRQVVDHRVWVHAPNLPVDPTVTYTQDDCDHYIYNDGTLKNLEEKVIQLGHNLGFAVRKSS